MKHIFLKGAALALLATGAAASNEYTSDLTQLADSTIRAWSADTRVIEAVRDQNKMSAGLSQSAILDLDQTWRDQTVSGGEMIDEVLANSLSVYLRDLQAQGQGQFTEIFVTDIRGLNVGQSNVTSDYWQGDEDKWQVPYDTAGMHLGDVEFDESTQTYQSQISLPIFDQEAVIGVITVGINLEQLAAIR